MRPSSRHTGFGNTRWTDVITAQNPDDPRHRDAVNRLVSAYWRPIYTFLRMKRVGPEDAADATQGFFTYIIEKEVLTRVTPGVGRFRDFLVKTLHDYTVDLHRAKKAVHRGGRHKQTPQDIEDAEKELRSMPADRATPEAAFLRVWAKETMAIAFETLRIHLNGIKEADRFEIFHAYLSGEGDLTNTDLQKKYGKSEQQIKDIIKVTKKIFMEHMGDAVRATVGKQSDIADEVRDLMKSV